MTLPPCRRARLGLALVRALLLLLACLSMPAVARAASISVVSGTYGGNCGRATGNQTDALARACDGRASCDYRVDYTVIGDPAPGCGKTYVAVWRCDGGPNQSVTVPAEAGFGSTARLTCAGYGKAAGGATCPASTMITTEEECRAAGQAVGHPFLKSVEVSSSEMGGRPGGCFWDQNGSSYFNRNLSATATWTGTGGICRSGGTPSPTPPTPPNPGPVAGKPAEVQGATLTASQLRSTMIWMAGERLLVETPFCYRQGYDRGVGTVPEVCGPGRDKRGAFCYDACRAGFQDNGTPTCLQTSCPSGYTDMGLMCHYNGTAMYSPVRWDDCAEEAPEWLFGGGCVGGLVEDDCRAGFHKSASMCYLDLPPGMSGSPLDPMKASYTRPVAGTPACSGGRVLEDGGMCYVPAKQGYSCNVTNCNPACASGTVDCGPAACASTTEACARGITDMVVGPLQIVAFAATGGAAGPVITAGKAAKALSAVKGAGTANDLLAAQGIFTDTLTDAMDAAEGDLASISSEYAEAQVAARYGRESANYKRIAREWVAVMVTILAVQAGVDVGLLAASMVDQTGVVGTITAYAKPPCQQHQPMP